jgi:hypothetical protein
VPHHSSSAIFSAIILVFNRLREAVDNSEQARRTRQNVIALAILALILLAGTWLLHDLKTSADLLDCLSSGRRDCGAAIGAAPGP